MKKLLLSALMLTLALPAFAFDIPMPDGMKLNMYGQVRFAAYYDYQSVKPDGGDTETTKSDLLYNLQGNSRLGWNFSAGNFKANVELNFNQDSVNPNGFGFRQFWGAYTFDNGLTLTAGYKTTLTGNQGSFGDIYDTDNGIKGYGTIGDTRRPLIMFSFAGLDFAMVSNAYDHEDTALNKPVDEYTYTEQDVLNDNGDKIGTYQQVTGTKKSKSGKGYRENYIPRFELAYNMKFGDYFRGKVFATYGLFTEEASTTSNDHVNVHAWHVGAYVNPTFGRFYIKGGLFYGMNVNMYNALPRFVGKPTIEADVDDREVKVKDVKSFGVALAAGMKDIVDNLSAELGGGYSFTSYDAKGKDDLHSYSVYAQSPYRFNQYVSVIPQIGYYGYSASVNNSLMAGAQLRVFF